MLSHRGGFSIASVAMSDEGFNPEEAQALTAIVGDDDLFRRVIRGWAMVEEALEEAIAGILVEPVPLGGAFRHKLTLAIGLGIIEPESRKSFETLATIRNKLAHSRRQAEDIPASEFEEIVHGFMPGATWAPQATPNVHAWSSFALAYAWTSVKNGGRIAREMRERERAALRRELDNVPPIVRAILGGSAALYPGDVEGEPQPD